MKVSKDERQHLLDQIKPEEIVYHTPQELREYYKIHPEEDII